MYVCICHGFTDSQVRDLTDQGCRSLAQVYRHLSGEPPQCGKCVPHVREMLKTAANVACDTRACARAEDGFGPIYAAAAE
jgi:bacterioferritin-associated ferredoxin